MSKGLQRSEAVSPQPLLISFLLHPPPFPSLSTLFLTTPSFLPPPLSCFPSFSPNSSFSLILFNFSPHKSFLVSYIVFSLTDLWWEKDYKSVKLFFLPLFLIFFLLQPQLLVFPQFSKSVKPFLFFHHLQQSNWIFTLCFFFFFRHTSISDIELGKNIILQYNWLHTQNFEHCMQKKSPTAFNWNHISIKYRATSVLECLTCRTNQFSNRKFKMKMPQLSNKILVIEQHCQTKLTQTESFLSRPLC